MSADAVAAPTSFLRRRSRLRTLFFALLIGLWTAGLGWAGIRTFWWLRAGVGVSESPGLDAVWHLHYQELYSTGVLKADLAPRDGYYDVLLLGGSVLEQTAPALTQSLTKELGARCRVFNLAKAAHTSRDSYFKMQRLAGKPFDLVVFYDGINDARMNCCADNVFRDDYRHFTWYDSLEARLAAGTIGVSDILAASLNRGRLSYEVTEGREFSERVKTTNAYRHNIESIAGAVERTGGRLLLSTFAYYLPANYSEETFRAHQLGYGHGKYDVSVNVWGTPKGVEAAISAHNGVIRDLARVHKNFLFVDEDKQMPKCGTCFSDCCHFTDEGVSTFVEDVLRAVRGDLARWKLAQHPVVAAN
jgi:hypothetical protein